MYVFYYITLKHKLLYMCCCTGFQMPVFVGVLPPSWVVVLPIRLQSHLNVITLFLIQVTISSCDLLVVSVGQMSMSRAINITQKLWTAGITAEIMYDWSQVRRQKAPVGGVQLVMASMAHRPRQLQGLKLYLPLWLDLLPVVVSDCQ